MTDTDRGGAADATEDVVAVPTPRRRFAWLRELLLVVGFYNVYQIVRGQADVGAQPRAFRHARWVVNVERWLHIFVEPDIQRFALHRDWLITFTNTYYGTLHFLVTGGLLIWLFFRRHDHYPRMRNTLAIMTLLGLVVFWAFPLAPPRMYTCNDDVPAPGPAGYQIGKCFVDTLNQAGGVWSYKSPVAKAIANQYAAMPSLHFGWALWSCVALLLFTGNRWLKRLGVFHAAFTLFAIVATANHFILDAVGGAVVFGIAWVLSGRIARRRRPAPTTLAPSVPAAAPG